MQGRFGFQRFGGESGGEYFIFCRTVYSQKLRVRFLPQYECVAHLCAYSHSMNMSNIKVEVGTLSRLSRRKSHTVL